MGGRPRLLTRAPSLAGALVRPRLVDVGTTPVVAISGPSGSGTSTLAAQIAAADHTGRGATTSWCRLAPGYDTAADVVAMVADTLDPAAELVPARRVIDLAEQLLDLLDRGPATIVVDDHHLAADGDLDRVVAECAGLLPDASRIVIAGAARPAGVLGLLPQHSVRVIDVGELAFEVDEARGLFELHGAAPDDAARWHRALAGWGEGMAAGARAPDSDPAEHVAVLLDQLSGQGPAAATIVDAAAAVAYVNVDLLAQLGVDVDPPTFAAIVESSPLLVDHVGDVELVESAARLHRARADASHLDALRVRAAGVLAAGDPATAIDALLDAREHEAAADVLAAHLSEIGVERALTWLYRLPAELRRRFPPVLAAGQATVEVDAALADAEARVEAATTERSRREALFALGSVEAHRGELAAAAGAYEAALRAARDDPAAAERITAELATTRWLLGDVLGARAALDEARATSASRWLAAQLDAAEGDAASLRAAVGGPADDAHDHAAIALAALALDDLDTAHDHAADGYALGVEVGGDAFVAACVARAWTSLRLGDVDDAVLVADELERRLGPRHRLARVHGAIIRERVSRSATGGSDHERDERRLRDLRAHGYASIERLATAALDRETDADRPPAVEVRVLGDHEVHIDGRVIGRADWTSKKALDVLTVLASHGPSGGRREQIIEAVWPGREPEKGRTLLRTALSEIRRRLEPDRPAGEPSRHLTTDDDLLVLDGALDLDLLDTTTPDTARVAFERLRRGLAPQVVASDWAQEWAGRIGRLTVTAATIVAEHAERPRRIEALEALIEAEPWQRRHYDRLAELHRELDDETAAADVERRWFDDD